jgi:uroporphyrinogen-III decarboxylase
MTMSHRERVAAAMRREAPDRCPMQISFTPEFAARPRDDMGVGGEFVEIGSDVLNPVQPACMDPAELKRDYGDRLLSWGSIDEQKTLPFGTPQDVRDEIALRLRTIGAGGGLILGPTHHVQLDTPLENFWAMIETIRETPYGSSAR